MTVPPTGPRQDGPGQEGPGQEGPGQEGRGPAAVVQAAVSDLAGRLGAVSGDVTVVQVAEVVWRDGSLGCPRPGRSYVQALVPGTLVVLACAGRRYSYHARAGRPPFLCENPQAPLRSGPSTQSDADP